MGGFSPVWIFPLKPLHLHGCCTAIFDPLSAPALRGALQQGNACWLLSAEAAHLPPPPELFMAWWWSLASAFSTLIWLVPMMVKHHALHTLGVETLVARGCLSSMLGMRKERAVFSKPHE